MKNQVNFSRNQPQDFEDLGGKHQAVYSGKCIVCGKRAYSERDYKLDGTLTDTYDPDWRGTIGAHSCDTMIASEYDMTGPDMVTCCECANDRERYNSALEIAKSQWTNTTENKGA